MSLHPNPQLVCTKCGARFSRVDHLTRHTRSSHDREKRFECPACGKAFGRSDVFVRHLRGHATERQFRSLPGRIPRACTNCAKSKVRCDKAEPCNYCSSRRLRCYRTSQPQRVRGRGFSNPLFLAEPNGNILSSANTVGVECSSGTEPAITNDPSNLTSGPPSSVFDLHYTDSYQSNFESSLFDQSAQSEDLERNYGETSGPHFADFQTGWDFNVPHWVPLDFYDYSFDTNLVLPSEQLTSSNVPLPSEMRISAPAQTSGIELSERADCGMAKRIPPSGAYIHVDDLPQDFFHRIVQYNDGTIAKEGTDGKKGYISPPKLLTAAFPELSSGDLKFLEGEHSCQVPEISQSSYERFMERVTETSTTKNVYGKLNVCAFPARNAVNCFIQLYFQYFQALFPIIHQPTFIPDESHWIEVLAVATIGCRFSGIPTSLQLAHAMSELLQTSIQNLIEIEGRSVRTLWLTTAMLLDQLGMIYSGSRKLLEVGLALGNAVTTQIRRNNYLQQFSSRVEVDETTPDDDLYSTWINWTREECRRRAGFGCWIIQCQLPLNFEIPGSMRLSEMNADLPCPEDLWEATTAQDWKTRFLRVRRERKGSASNVNSVLRGLVKGERLPPMDVGNFGRLVLVHAIYATAFELRVSFQNPLCQGLNFGACRFEDAAFFHWQKGLLPLLELLQPVREATDRISSSPGELSSSNQRTSVMIFTASQHVSLRTFAPIGDFLVYSSAKEDGPEKQAAEQRLLVWTADDSGRTARRAVLHACVLFTTIRTNSSGGFHEPIAFLVSTLTIWIYNHLIRGPGNQMTMALDKVWSSKAVQVWLEGGPRAVSGYLTDVGNINEPRAGRVLLEVARQSLLHMSSWGLSQGFASFLDSLRRRA